MDGDRPRARAAVAIIIFTALWIFLVVPWLLASESFQAQPPPVQYLAYNAGFLLLFVGIGWLFLHSAPVGLAGFLDFSWILDNLQPPFAYSPAGELLIPDQGTLVGASVDRFLGWIAESAGLRGPPVFWFVYAVAPIVAVIVTVLVVRRRRRQIARA